MLCCTHKINTFSVSIIFVVDRLLFFLLVPSVNDERWRVRTEHGICHFWIHKWVAALTFFPIIRYNETNSRHKQRENIYFFVFFQSPNPSSGTFRTRVPVSCTLTWSEIDKVKTNWKMKKPTDFIWICDGIKRMLPGKKKTKITNEHRNRRSRFVQIEFNWVMLHHL